MSFLENLFNAKKVDCPRCLGNGEVSLDDIKRLKMELKWIPGPCAYCEGKGQVSEKFISRVAVDCSYLTDETSVVERRRLMNRDAGALRRAEYFEESIDLHIKQIIYLYEIGKITPGEIMEYYFLDARDQDNLEEDKSDFLDYINRIIEHKANTN